MENYISNSVDETDKIAREIASKVPKGSVIELIGEMGAGKTAFAKGFAKGLNVKEVVTSPTFALLNTYDCGDGSKLYHFDLYRLEDIEELYLLGFEELFYPKNDICLIEWPQIAVDILPKHKMRITITKQDANRRKIEVENI